MPEDKNKKTPSELRFDIVSKDWVVIATGRAKRPEMFKEEQEKVWEEKGKKCPFCNIGKKDKPVLAFVKGKKQENIRELPADWSLVVIPNKYPAVVPSKSLRERAEGPYQMMDGIGFHEIVITRDHHKDMTQSSAKDIKEVLDAYQERYLELMNEPNVNYISIFHNHGKKAGASIAHPHSQIMAIPVIDPDLQGSLIGSRRYFDFHKKCIYCEMIKWDKQDGRRVVFENDDFIALCPFASRMAFSIRIYPKEHLSYFERANERQKKSLAEAFQVSLSKLRKALGRFSYNFFLRTAPCNGRDYSHFHWHFEVLPRTSVQAGFEFGAGIEISSVEPEKAAEYLRKQ